MIAAEYNSIDSMHALIKAGAEPDIRDQKGNTAAKLAYSENSVEIWMMLKKAGAYLSPKQEQVIRRNNEKK